MRYVICQEAVYMHRIFGPYDTTEDAIRRADGLAREDVDAHHEWVVRSLDPVLGLGERIYSVCKPNCAHCGAAPSSSGMGQVARPCPCVVRANLAGGVTE